MFGLHWCFSLVNFILISIVIGLWKSFVFGLGVAWRSYKASLSVIAGRPLELCQSFYLTPALAAGWVGWVLILGALASTAAIADARQALAQAVQRFGRRGHPLLDAFAHPAWVLVGESPSKEPFGLSKGGNSVIDSEGSTAEAAVLPVSEDLQTSSMAHATDPGAGAAQEIPPTGEADASEPARAAPSATDAALEKLIARVEQLARQLEEANRLSAERERIIDRLHAENQSLRAGELQQAQSPLFSDLVRLFDDFQKTIEGYAAESEVTVARVVHDLECYRDSVGDILYRQGIERYEAIVGTLFDGKQHRALAAVPTADESLDRTIARVIRLGFRSDTRIIRPLEAEVYRHTVKDKAPADRDKAPADRPE